MITWVAKNLIVSVLLNRSGVPIQSLGMGDLCWGDYLKLCAFLVQIQLKWAKLPNSNTLSETTQKWFIPIT